MTEAGQLFETPTGPKTEREWQSVLQRALTREGWVWQHIYRMQTKDGAWRTSTRAVGFPDLTAWRPPFSLAIECKMGKQGTKHGDPTPQQVAWLETFAALPSGRAWCLRPQADWQQIADWLHDPTQAPRIHGWVPLAR